MVRKHGKTPKDANHFEDVKKQSFKESLLCVFFIFIFPFFLSFFPQKTSGKHIGDLGAGGGLILFHGAIFFTLLRYTLG